MPQRQSDLPSDRPPDLPSDLPAKRAGHAIDATETVGLLLIAFLMLALTVIRYWHDIHWSLR